MKFSLPHAAAAAILVGACAASADDTVFRWQASDLATPERVAGTHSRIEALARDYCEQALYGTRDLRRRNQCVGAVTDELVGGIGDSRLTAFAETGQVQDGSLARR